MFYLCKIHGTFLLPAPCFHHCYVQNWDLDFLPQLCLGAHSEGGGGMLQLLSGPAGCRIVVPITLQDVDFYIEMHRLQLDSSLLFSSIFSLSKNFVYTGNEGEVSGKCCAFAGLLHCGGSEGGLDKTHTELYSLSHL